jgi:uncharacterized protein (DUF4415 family)
MATKRHAGSADWTDPDDAPELTAELRDKAEEFHGDVFVRRSRGRPKSAATKEQISVRLDPDVVAKLREAGPGWQSRINALLRQALGLEAAREPCSLTAMSLAATSIKAPMAKAR